MRNRKKFKLIISLLIAIILFETVECIRVPTDWAEIRPEHVRQARHRVPKQTYQTLPKSQRRTIHTLSDRNSRSFDNDPGGYGSGKPQYRTLPVVTNNNSPKNVYPKTYLRPVSQPLYAKPSTIHTYGNVPLIALMNPKPQVYKKPPLYIPQPKSKPYVAGNPWVPIQVINEKYNLAPLLTADKKYSKPPVKNPENEINKPLKAYPSKTDEDVEESVEESEQPEVIPSFANKIYENIPFSTDDIWKETELKPSSINPEKYKSDQENHKSDQENEKSDQEEDSDSSESDEEEESEEDSEDPEQYQVPQDATPISEHEYPLEIPTKPIYPGEGQWAKPGRRHQVYQRPELPKIKSDDEDERPDGYEIFEEGSRQFDQANEKFQDQLQQFPRRHNIASNQYEANPSTDSGSHSHPKVPGFIPLKMYAQVRKTETTKHVPQSEAYKEASTEEELLNAPRLREVVKNTRAHTVYTEEGYEDEAYDHAGHEKNAENHEDFRNQERDLEDVKEQTRKRENTRYNDDSQQSDGSENKFKIIQKDSENQNDGNVYDKEHLEAIRDTKSSSTEYKQNVEPVNTEEWIPVEKPQRTIKNQKDRGWSKSQVTKETKQTVVKDMGDGVFDTKIKNEFEMIRNPGGPGMKKYKYISIITPDKNPIQEPSKNLEDTIDSATHPSIFDTFTENPTVLPTDTDNVPANFDEVLGSTDSIIDISTRLVPSADVQESYETTTSVPEILKIKPKRSKTRKKVKNYTEDSISEKPIRRVKRYDREKLSKIYIRKRPVYYWEKSKNRGNTKIEFPQNNLKKDTSNKNDKNENITVEESEVEKKSPIKTSNRLNRPSFRSRLKRNSNSRRPKRLQIDHPTLNFDELTYDIVDVSKFVTPTPKPDLTFVKYPYYLMAKKGKINKDSPLKYAEDLRRIPKKIGGDMSFYKSTASVQCPEIEPNVDPIPDRIKNKEVNGEDTENEDGKDDLDKKIQPHQQVQRLKGLGDKIDCMKVKYFGEDPLDSPFFKEDIIEEPSLDSVFPNLQKNQAVQKQSGSKIVQSNVPEPIAVETNTATTEKVELTTLISKDSEYAGKVAKPVAPTQWVTDNIQFLAGYLNNSTTQKHRKQKRDTSAYEESQSVPLDTIVVLDEEHTPDNDEAEMEKLVIISKNESTKSNMTAPITTESTIMETTTENLQVKTKNKEASVGSDARNITKSKRRNTEAPVLTTTEAPKKNKVSDFILSHLSTLRPDSEEITTPPSLISTSTTTTTTTTTTRRPIISTTINPTINEIPRQKRRRPIRPTKNTSRAQQKASRRIHYNEEVESPDNFLIIIDTNGQNIADVPLQLPLVDNNKQFSEIFDINKYFPKLDLNLPNVEYEFETQSFKTKKTPDKVQMEVFADILQHITTTTVKPRTRRPTQKFSRSTTTERTTESTPLPIQVDESDESDNSNGRKRKIKKPPKRSRLKIRNSTAAVDDESNIQSNNDLPVSGTEEHYVKEALEVEDLNKDNPQFKYPGTFKTLYLQDEDNINRDVYTPEDHYKDVPEYSSDPDHTSATYEHEPDVTHNEEFNSNKNEEDEYLSHLEYDLIYNRVHKTYLLRPTKKFPFKPSLTYSSGFRPLPHYSPEFKPVVENEFEEVLIHGLKPVRQGNSLRLAIPYKKIPKQYVQNFQTTYSLRPVTSHKQIRQPVRIIRLKVKPKKIIRVKPQVPQLRIVSPPKVHVLPVQIVQPISQPVLVPYHFHRHKVTTKHTNYYNIEGMVPPLVSEHAIDYSHYQPATFSASSHQPQNYDFGATDSIADENHLNRKSFEDLQMESSDNLATIVDLKGRPITQAQRKYLELDRLNRQANLYKKPTETQTATEELFPMEGEVLMLKESPSENIANIKRYDENSTRLKFDDLKAKDGEKTSLKDSYGNVINKPLLNGYSTVVKEMSNESKKYVTEAHQPNMNPSRSSEPRNNRRKNYHKNSPPYSTSTTTSVVITSVDSRRNEPKYENRAPNPRLPITNHRRYKHTSPTPQSESDLSVFKTLNAPEVFDINDFIPDTDLKRDLRQNHSLHHPSSNRLPNNFKQGTATSESRKYSSRFNSADVQLPLSTDKTLQKPVVLVIEEKIRTKGDHNTLQKEEQPTENVPVIESIPYDETTRNNPKKLLPPAIAPRVGTFRRKRPIPVTRTTSSISTIDTTETSIRKTLNRPRTLHYLKNAKNRSTDTNRSTDPSQPSTEQRKEHTHTTSLVNRTNRFNTKSVRTNQNNSKREKLVVDPIQLRHKARADAEAEARERIKEKLAESENGTSSKKLFENVNEPPLPLEDKLFIDGEDGTLIEVSVPAIIKTQSAKQNKAQKRIDDDEDDAEEKDELLNKDYSDQVEIIGDLEQIKNGPKHGGNYRHINDKKNDQKTGYTNHDDRTSQGHNLDEEHHENDEDHDEDSDHQSVDEAHHNEHEIADDTKIKTKSLTSDEYLNASSFYNDRNLPKYINNLKYTLKDPPELLVEDEDHKKKTEDDIMEESSASVSKFITISNKNGSSQKPSAVWAKVIKDPSKRQYFYVRE